MNAGDFVFCGVCRNEREIGQRHLVEKCGNCGDEEYTLSVISDPPIKNYFAGENEIWCDMCQCFVQRSELKRWTGDDALHHLCPGCDSDLLPIESIE